MTAIRRAVCSDMQAPNAIWGTATNSGRNHGTTQLNTPKAKECPLNASDARLWPSLLAEPGRCPARAIMEDDMNRTLSRLTIASTVAACTVLGACAKKGNVAVSDTTAAPAMADTTASAGAVASPKNDWTDAQILAFASAANSGEIQEAKLAQHKAMNPAVKKYAAMMIADHSRDAGRRQGARRPSSRFRPTRPRATSPISRRMPRRTSRI